ncbi:MAG: hypothetical protein J2P19_13475 [Pseudonocardia sp.]|nr:hypothetical protein [Pseudonocardia sp.]
MIRRFGRRAAVGLAVLALAAGVSALSTGTAFADEHHSTHHHGASGKPGDNARCSGPASDNHCNAVSRGRDGEPGFRH